MQRLLHCVPATLPDRLPQRCFPHIIQAAAASLRICPITKPSSCGSASGRLYRATFKPGAWEGAVEAFDLPYAAGDAPVWEAGSLLESRSADSRTIYTSVGDRS